MEQKLDRIIELLEALVQRWSPMELPKTNTGPIVRDLHQVPNPYKPKITPIVFEDTASPFASPLHSTPSFNSTPSPNGSPSKYECPPGWVTSIHNDDFEINETDMRIRHKLSKRECKIVYDKQLYAVPWFDDYTFDEEKPPKRYIRVVAEQFVTNDKGCQFAVPKNGNRFDFRKENVKWTNERQRDKKQLSDEIVGDKTFVGPHAMLNEENFTEHNLIEWKNEIWQETQQQMYVKAPKVKDGWLVLTDEGNVIVVGLSRGEAK
jgi:hypothetical protein